MKEATINQNHQAKNPLKNQKNQKRKMMDQYIIHGYQMQEIPKLEMRTFSIVYVYVLVLK